MRLVAVYAAEVRGVTLRSCVGLRTAEASQLPLAASRNVTEEPASVALQRVVNVQVDFMPDQANVDVLGKCGRCKLNANCA